jgi:GTP cyclohydrolase FolE2
MSQVTTPFGITFDVYIDGESRKKSLDHSRLENAISQATDNSGEPISRLMEEVERHRRMTISADAKHSKQSGSWLSWTSRSSQARAQSRAKYSTSREAMNKAYRAISVRYDPEGAPIVTIESRDGDLSPSFTHSASVSFENGSVRLSKIEQQPGPNAF